MLCIRSLSNWTVWALEQFFKMNENFKDGCQQHRKRVIKICCSCVVKFKRWWSQDTILLVLSIFTVAFVFSDKCMDIVSTAIKDSKDDTKERLSPSKEMLRKLQQGVMGPTFSAAGSSKTTSKKKRRKK